MGTGIIVCGLNGAGKSTLARALAQEIGCAFMDNEDYFFPKKNRSYMFADPRTHEEVERMLLEDAKRHDHFVFAAVRGNYGKAFVLRLSHAVVVDVPKEMRMQRVRKRSYQKFGERMLPGGDLYEKEERFFRMTQNRSERDVEDWLATTNCSVIRVDGTLPVRENVERIAAWLRDMGAIGGIHED